MNSYQISWEEAMNTAQKNGAGDNNLIPQANTLLAMPRIGHDMVDPRSTDEITQHINSLKALTRTVAMRAAINIGADLLELKKRIPHGEWGEWLREHVDYSERTAQQLMQVAKEYATASEDLLDRLSVAQALAMVSLTWMTMREPAAESFKKQ